MIRWPWARRRPVIRPVNVKAAVAVGGRALPVEYRPGGRRQRQTWTTYTRYPGPGSDVTVTVDEVPAGAVLVVGLETRR